VDKLTLQALEAFCEVARHKSFHRAAEALQITQSAVSQRIDALERALGRSGRPFRLLERSSRSVALTASGLHALELAQEIALGCARLRQYARGGPGPLARLRLGVSETIAQTWLSSFLERVRERYPQLSLEVEIDISPQLGQRLLRQDLDLAFLLNPPTDPQLVTRPLCHYAVSFLASPGLLPPERPLPLAQLAPYPILTFSRNTQPYLEVLQLLRQPGLPRLQLYACASLAPVVRMAKERVGVAVIPEEVAHLELEQGALERIETTARLRKLRFCASWLALGEAHASGELGAVTELARAACARRVSRPRAPGSGGPSPASRPERA
jgi:DNA-binding transcriptional LysR family regulator